MQLAEEPWSVLKKRRGAGTEKAHYLHDWTRTEDGRKPVTPRDCKAEWETVGAPQHPAGPAPSLLDPDCPWSSVLSRMVPPNTPLPRGTRPQEAEPPHILPVDGCGANRTSRNQVVERAAPEAACILALGSWASPGAWPLFGKPTVGAQLPQVWLALSSSAHPGHHLTSWSLFQQWVGLGWQ